MQPERSMQQQQQQMQQQHQQAILQQKQKQLEFQQQQQLKQQQIALQQQQQQQQPLNQAPPTQAQSVQPQQTPVQQLSQSLPASPAATQGVKRRPVSDIQEPNTLAKKAKVAPIAPSPVQPAINPNTQPAALIHIDKELIEEAEEREGGTWPGVPNIVIGEAPVKLKRNPPTKRYVVITAKGGKDPLFPNLPRGWTMAESLGNHLEAYQNAKDDIDKQRADARLEIELRRNGSEIPPEWWKKMNRETGQRMDPPPEPINTSIKSAESLRIHPLHKSNKRVLMDTFDDFYTIIMDKAAELKNTPVMEKLLKFVRARTKNPAAGKDSEFNALKVEVEPLRAKLEAAIVEALNHGDPRVLRRFAEKGNLPVRLVNLLNQLINVGDASCGLSKAILRFIGTLTNLKPSQLEAWKFQSTKQKLEAQGDAEAKNLIAVIFSNAEKNSDKDAEEAKSAKETGETKKSAKAPTKIMSASSTKRPREDDTNGDVRSSKKATTQAKPTTSSSAVTNNGKTPSMATTKTPTVIKALPSKPSSVMGATAVGPAKPRSGLLLPGKTRPVVKPVPKPEAVKIEGSKLLAKAENMPKPPVVKSEASKPLASKPAQTASTSDASKNSKPKPAAESSSTSRFAALLAEIAEPKKVKASRSPPPTAAPDPNETEEQRTRRLRKEERRRLGLRVAFKGDDRLVEIREFARHPEEIEFTHGTLRDIKSDGMDKSEGMALKKSHTGEIKAWSEPSSIELDNDASEETFVKNGGKKEAETEQRKAMDNREANELMVFYTDPTDIPPTPKSPPYEPDVVMGGTGAASDTLPAEPQYDEARQRSVEFAQEGVYRAAHHARLRRSARSNPNLAGFTKTMKSLNSIADSYNGFPATVVPGKAGELPIATSASVAPDVTVQASAVPVPVAIFNDDARDQKTFEIVSSNRVKAYKDPQPYDPATPTTVRRRDYPDPRVQRAADYVEDTVDHLKNGKPLPPPLTEVEIVAVVPVVQSKPEIAVPPVSIVAPAVPAPVLDVAAVVHQQAPVDNAAAWAQYYAAQQQQQQAWYGQQQQAAYTQPVNPYQQPAAAASAQQGQVPAISGDPNQLSAILSALGGATQPQPQQPQQQMATDPAQMQALIAALAGGQLPQQQAPADPQNAEYIMNLMKWASGQAAAGGAAAASAAPAVDPYQAYAAYSQQQYGGAQHQQHQQDREQERGSERSDRSQPQHQPVNHINNHTRRREHRDRDRDRTGRDRNSGGLDYDDVDTTPSNTINNNNNGGDGSAGGGRKGRHKNRGGGGGGGMDGAGGGNNNRGGGNDDVPEHLRGINRNLIGTKQCTFWARGQCAKGDKCTFRHD